MEAQETNLDKYLHTVRRIEEHREDEAVNALKRLYKRLVKRYRAQMGEIYAQYADAETGQLSYAQLHTMGLDARLLEEVAANINDVTLAEKKLITQLVEETYNACYAAMTEATQHAVDDDDLARYFAQVESAKPQALKAAVDNPVHGLTLPQQLEKNRADIIYTIKQAVGVGLSVGDRYDTMARRIQTALIGSDGAGGSYAKSVRIARTEAHRCREQGNLDAAKNLTEKLQPAGVTMMKTWHTMKDERVRPNKSYKTKKGWKYSKSGKYNHVAMEGITIPVNEKFKLPSGAEAMSPGQSGVAGEDINCRCFLSYSVRKNEESTEKVSYEGIPKTWQRLQEGEKENLEVFESERKETDEKKFSDGHLKFAYFRTGKMNTQEYVRSKEPLGDFQALPDSQVVNVLRKESAEWIKKLTEEEKRAIQKYTYNSGDKKPNRFFERLNAMLRGDAEEDDRLKRYADTISRGLNKGRVQHDVICYRTMDFNIIQQEVPRF